VQFRGREIAHADLGKKLLIRFAGDLTAYGTVEGQPRMEGRNAHVLISPTKSPAKIDKPEKSEKPEKIEKPEPPAPPAGA
jgi:translation initiation factor IF-3